MPAPGLTFSVSASKISSIEGFNKVSVAFSSDIAYSEFECRATKTEDEYGVGKGILIAYFSNTPAETERTFDIYDEYLTRGDGRYRISLFAKSLDGAWNDNYNFISSDVDGAFITADGKEFLCVR